MRSIPNRFALLPAHAAALIDLHMTGMAQAGTENVTGLDSAPFAVLGLVAVSAADCSVIYSAVLAWNLAIGMHQLGAAYVFGLWYHATFPSNFLIFHQFTTSSLS